MKYLFTKKTWETLFTGANNCITYGLEATNPDFKKSSGHMQFWHINAFVFCSSKQNILDHFEITSDEYDQLLAELKTFPTHAIKK